MPKIRVKFTFLLFNALIFIFRDSSLIMGFYAACLIHEAGHVAAVYLTGGEVLSVEFGWTGIKMTASAPKNVRCALFVQLSGPAANLLTFLVLTAWGRSGYFAVFSLAEGLLNLLPYKFLDGGATLELLAESSKNEKRFRFFNNLLRIFISISVGTFLFGELSKLIPSMFIY